MEKTIFIIGLGNPGEEYEGTRHNAGFAVISNLQLVIGNCSSWKYEKKFDAEISECRMDGKRILLAKPHTFMNDSGRSVQKIITNYPGFTEDSRQSRNKLPITNLWVIHDDLALPLGTIRVRMNGSSGGHKGVQSIVDSLQSEEFVRIRVGIKPSREIKDTKKFVLQKFSKKEQEIIKKLMSKSSELIKEMIERGVEETTLSL